MDQLNFLEKPIRYTGHEWNAVTDKFEAKLRFGFVYPDVYEVGMSFLGLQILYGLLNKQEWVWCERAFAPWKDREVQLREEGQSLSTLESDTPLCNMHMVGFSLQHEMLYTNVLNILELGGIPLDSKTRSDEHPIIIAGGPCAYNPMPVADFIDAFIIGEAEEVLIELCECYQKIKEAGGNRDSILRSLAQIAGVFIPGLYTEETNRIGEVILSKPKDQGIPEVVNKRIVTDFENSYYPAKQMVPNTKVVHHRLALEIMRGCQGGCRFCQAGFTDRPVRERSPERINKDAREALCETGFDEMSLLSLSTADYTALPTLCESMIHEFAHQRIALSLPSLRIDSFPSRVTEEIGKIRNTGLTFAPEAGTERLRWAINKLIYDSEIFAKVRESVTSNQDTVKLYFMIGLPTETDDDLQGIVNMVLRIKQILREAGKKRAKLHVGISPFVPKPHTPYQWYGQISLDEMKRRIQFIASKLKPYKVKVNWHDPYKSLVEGALARGDKQTANVIKTAYKNSSRFDEWHEYFSFERWEKAFTDHGLSIYDYAMKQYEKDDSLPWQCVSINIDSRYLWREWEKTFRHKGSRHCGNEMCRVCKVCDGEQVVTVHAPQSGFSPKAQYNMEHELASSISLKGRDAPQENTVYRYRLRFWKYGRMIYASHHDTMMLFESIFRRVGIDLAFSEGFHPHPKIIFASALPVGVESRGDYMDIHTIKQYDENDLKNHLNRFCPEGIKIADCVELNQRDKKITAVLAGFQFLIYCSLPSEYEKNASKINDILHHPELAEELNLYDSEAKVDDGTFCLDYTCKVTGGQYTKAKTIVSKLETVLGLPLEIDRVIRLDIFSKSEDGKLKSLSSQTVMTPPK